MYRLPATIALVGLLMTTGCTVAPPEPAVRDVGPISSISNTSDVQTTIIKKHGDPERYCAARQSDVADTRSVGGSIAVSGAATGSEGISEGSSQGALALGGRSPAVLIVREMMYRACELSLNLNADNDETMEIYKLFMEKTKEITSIQTGSGSTALGEGASVTGATSAPISSSSSSSSDSDSDSGSVSVQGVD